MPEIFYSSSIDEFIEQLLPAVRGYSQIFVLSDDHVKEHCYPLIAAHLPPHSGIEIGYGEMNKNWQTCSFIWDALNTQNADRKSVLLNFGGGIITDIGGFAASCYKRGIAFINIPTTLLGMADAAIGGKTGIDFNGCKNEIGLFNNAAAVFCCSQFLKTLPYREWRAGFAEIVKHYLIADADKFEMLAEQAGHPDTIDITYIKAAADIKVAIVTQDPLEQNVRKALNFGHTIGHAIESALLQNEQDIFHGEAVAMGMIAEAFLSNRKKLLKAAELQKITTFLIGLYGFKKPLRIYREAILSFIAHDKKNVSGQSRFTLLNGIGNFKIDVSVSNPEVEESLDFFDEKIIAGAA